MRRTFKDNKYNLKMKSFLKEKSFFFLKEEEEKIAVSVIWKSARDLHCNEEKQKYEKCFHNASMPEFKLSQTSHGSIFHLVILHFSLLFFCYPFMQRCKLFSWKNWNFLRSSIFLLAIFHIFILDCLVQSFKINFTINENGSNKTFFVVVVYETFILDWCELKFISDVKQWMLWHCEKYEVEMLNDELWQYQTEKFKLH